MLAARLALLGAAAVAAAPLTTSPPTVEGTPAVGQTLSAGNGGWLNAPTSYAYQWQRCAATGAGCASIPGATAVSYRVQTADAAHALRVLVTATNASGSATANSHPVVVGGAGAAPAGTRPLVTGTPRVGEELRVTGALANPAQYRFQWQRCAGATACVDVPGALGWSYGVRAADLGRTLRVAVTGVAGGTAPIYSDPTAAVAAATGAAPVAPAPTPVPSASCTARPGAAAAAVSIAQVSPPDRLRLAAVEFSPSVLRARSPFVAKFRVTDTCGRPVSGALVLVLAVPPATLARAPETATDATGWATLRLTPTASARIAPRSAIYMFVRARKPGEDVLGGVSTRRLAQLVTR